MQNIDDLIRLFEACFTEQFNTRLTAGAPEPLYEPATGNVPAEIFFREDYFASALHEIAHWCIAGDARRMQRDYGYWYIADGRNAEQQQTFYSVEVKPQALEWCFSVACNYPFKISVDNIEAAQSGWLEWQQQAEDIEQFKQKCLQQVKEWLSPTGQLPQRGAVFIDALSSYYRDGKTLEFAEFEALTA